MCILLKTSDFQMYSKDQTDNFEVSGDNRQEYDYRPIVWYFDPNNSVEDDDPPDLKQYFGKSATLVEFKPNNKLKPKTKPRLEVVFENRAVLSNSGPDKYLNNPPGTNHSIPP